MESIAESGTTDETLLEPHHLEAPPVLDCKRLRTLYVRIYQNAPFYIANV